MGSSFELIRKSVVRIVHGSPTGATFGTGVIVSAGMVLTARHVIDPAELSLRGGSPPASEVSIESAAYRGTRVADQLVFPASPTVDLGLARLVGPKAMGGEYSCAVYDPSRKAVNVGDEVDVCGHSTRDGDLQVDTLTVVAVHGNAGAFVCNRSVPAGFSGGPVFVEGGLVGVMFARHFENDRSYFYGGEQLRELLSPAHADDVRWSTQAVSPLRAYPLGPGVGRGETLRRLGYVVDAYARLYEGARAVAMVAKANALRAECGPDTGERGLIEPHLLPNPHHDLYGYWQQAFVVAGLKSPRMLAALLTSAEPDELDAQARRERDGTLIHLAGLSGMK